MSGCLPVQKKGSLKKSIEHQIHLEKINYPRQISSSHADFDKKKVWKTAKCIRNIKREKWIYTWSFFFSFVKLIMVEWCSKDGLVNIQIKFPLLMLLLPLLVDFTKKLHPSIKYRSTQKQKWIISLWTFFFIFCTADLAIVSFSHL